MGAFIRFVRHAPGRVGATLFGIALGFFALTVMSAMALHFHRVAERFALVARGKLFVREESGFFGGGALSVEGLARFGGIAGVREMVPMLVGRLRKAELYVFGLPELIVAFPPGREEVLYEGARLMAGRWLTAGDSRGCVVGADLARGLRVGGELVVKGRPFVVMGMLERTGGYEDKQVILTLDAGQRLLGKPGLASFGVLLPTGEVAPETIAREVARRDENVEALLPAQLEQSTRSAVLLWDSLGVGLGVLAALIGGLLVLTIMTMSVTERVREIGIKRTFGASRLDIFREFLGEAAWLGFLGGWLGITGAIGFIRFFGEWLAARGMVLFELSPASVLLLAAAAGGLGLLGGTLPACLAAGYRPIEALRGKR